jgi:transposase
LNRAIHIIAMGRMAWGPKSRAYIQRRVSEGKTKREALGCPKHHIARQIWHLPVAVPVVWVNITAPPVRWAWTPATGRP